MKNFTLTLMMVFVSAISFAQTPSVSAGKNQTIYQGQSAYLKGKAVNVNHHLWVSNGTGSFDNPSALKTYYHPSTDDIKKGKVKLTLKSTTNAAVKDLMILTILPHVCPTVTMPSTDAICASIFGGEYPLNQAVVTGDNYSVLWVISSNNAFGYISNETSATDAVFVYTSSDGQAGQTFVFTITVTDNTGLCAPVSSSIAVKFNDPARIDALYVNGTDNHSGTISLCNSDPINLDAALSGTASSAYFSAGGSGQLVQTSNSSAVYYPTISDVINQYISFYASTNDPVGPCGPASASSDAMFQFGIPDAGPDITACIGTYDTYVPVNATVNGNGGTFYWGTNGTGYFDDMYSLSTNYNFSAADLTMPNLEIYAYSDGCSLHSDTAKLLINQAPTVYAGTSITVCGYNGGSVSLSASVTGTANNFYWSTSGSGGFNDANNPVTDYYYSQQDVNNAYVTLTATAENTSEACPSSSSSSLDLHLQEAASVYVPEPYVSACSSAPDVGVYAYSYGYAYGGQWSTSGSGSFDDPSSGYTTYHASQDDIDQGCIYLTYTVQGGGMCGGASGYVTACFYDCGGTDAISKTLPKTKDAILLYPNPANSFINIKIAETVNKTASFITDISGKIIACKWVALNSIDITQLSNGMYMLHIVSEKKNYAIKFVKQ